MKKIFVLSVFLAVLLGVSPVYAAQPKELPTTGTGIPLIVGVGQSNMAGTAAAPEFYFPVTGVSMMHWNGSSWVWVPMLEPSSVWNGVSGYNTANYGPASSFMRELMVKESWTEAGFINCAVGGSAITTWAPGQSNFENCWQRIADAQLSGYYVAGIIVANGETETNTLALANTYKSGMQAMYSGFTSRLGNNDLPMAYVKLGQVPPATNPSGGTVIPRPYWNTIRDYQQELFDMSNRPANWRIVSSWGIPRETVLYLHYATWVDYDELGERLANQIATVIP